MWPFYLRINELPPKERNSRENVILAGLRFGRKKPAANIFVSSFKTELKEFGDGRKKFNINGRSVTVKAKVLTGTCDLPAKCLFLNISQYNGDFGCNNCEQSGDTYRVKDKDGILTGGMVHVYRYIADPIIRNLQQTIIYSTRAVANGLVTVSLESTKKLLTLWFDTMNSHEIFSLRQVEEIINARLSNIKPPKFIHRSLTSVSKFGDWKASELRHWFYY